jgi:hypothetical protein
VDKDIEGIAIPVITLCVHVAIPLGLFCRAFSTLQVMLVINKHCAKPKLPI